MIEDLRALGGSAIPAGSESGPGPFASPEER